MYSVHNTQIHCIEYNHVRVCLLIFMQITYPLTSLYTHSLLPNVPLEVTLSRDFYLVVLTHCYTQGSAHTTHCTSERTPLCCIKTLCSNTHTRFKSQTFPEPNVSTVSSQPAAAPGTVTVCACLGGSGWDWWKPSEASSSRVNLEGARPLMG